MYDPVEKFIYVYNITSPNRLALITFLLPPNDLGVGTKTLCQVALNLRVQVIPLMGM